MKIKKSDKEILYNILIELQEFCMCESLCWEKTPGGDFAGKCGDAGLGGVLWKPIITNLLRIIV